jgi:hypothetical protein
LAKFLNRNSWEDFIMSANPNLCTTSMTLLAAGLTAGVITAAAAGSLELQDEGVFFVNGQAAATAFPDSPPTRKAVEKVMRHVEVHRGEKTSPAAKRRRKRIAAK